jgi:hypothetical protein
MKEMKNHQIVFQVLEQVSAHQSGSRQPFNSRRTSYHSILVNFMPIPEQTLFLGVATDGLPVLLDFSTPASGPLLIVGDTLNGKNLILRVIAEATKELFRPEQMLFSVLSRNQEDWDDYKESPNAHLIQSPSDDSARDFIRSISNWGHSIQIEKQLMLLLIDDLSALMSMDSEARQNLRWLLLRGPIRHIWPIVTLNPKDLPYVHPWMTFFNTRIFGKVSNSSAIHDLAGGKNPELATLVEGYEFMLREDHDWIKFRIPSFD